MSTFDIAYVLRDIVRREGTVDAVFVDPFRRTLTPVKMGVCTELLGELLACPNNQKQEAALLTREWEVMVGGEDVAEAVPGTLYGPRRVLDDGYVMWSVLSARCMGHDGVEVVPKRTAAFRLGDDKCVSGRAFVTACFGIDSHSATIAPFAIDTRVGEVRAAIEWLDEAPEQEDERRVVRAVCAGCGENKATKRCTGCMAVRYCSQECHSTDWTRHRAGCMPKLS